MFCCVCKNVMKATCLEFRRVNRSMTSTTICFRNSGKQNKINSFFYIFGIFKIKILHAKITKTIECKIVFFIECVILFSRHLYPTRETQNGLLCHLRPVRDLYEICETYGSNPGCTELCSVYVLGALLRQENYCNVFTFNLHMINRN